MTALAHALPALPRWRIFDWALRACRRMGWRHVVLSFALFLCRELFGPLGGVLFLPTPAPWNPALRLLNGYWLIDSLPIVYCVLVANEAFDDGQPPWRAYGMAVIAFSLFVPFAHWATGGRFGWEVEPATSIAWWAPVLLFQGGLGTSIYAYWRVTQRSMRHAQAAETERLRNEQRVQTARLLALQARVEPQMLFDSLGRVAALHFHEPQAADRLLADLIAMLRAMQPSKDAADSTVGREFALVEAWLRVSRSTVPDTPSVRTEVTPESRALTIAPMLVLPLVRAALASSVSQETEWVLSAHTTTSRLIVTLRSNARLDTALISVGNELGALHERLLRLYGRSAGLSVLPHVQSLTLDLPRLREELDDVRADR